MALFFLALVYMAVNLPDFIRRDDIVSLERQENALSNNVFVVETSRKKFVVKECQSELEYKMLELLGRPKIVYRSEGILVEEYIDHQKAEFSRDWKEIAYSLCNFHKIRVPFKLKTHSELVDSIVEEDLLGLDSHVVQVLRRAVVNASSLLQCTDAEMPTFTGVCHNDLQPSNILVTDKGILFIDFEYTSVGDQLVDIANIFCEVMCDYSCSSIDVSRKWTSEQKKAFLNEYFEGRDADYQKVLSRIDRLECFSHFLWYLWGRRSLQQGKSANGFCYLRYTQSRLSFLKDFMGKDDFYVLVDDLRKLSKQ